MATSFFFYDLETSGFSPREARIMQFAGQRTDLNLKPLGQPLNYFIKLSEDVLPDPDAVLVTGITPQKTISEGINEAEFLQIFHQEIAAPKTIFVGFNSVRFDDEFMRFLHFRNFYDAYEWHWADDRSRWDLLDVVRMTRALRPDGITWPFDSQGTPANRLELLTSVNKLPHKAAHDALSDVKATIAVAQLLRSKQPKLFDFLLKYRDKQIVAELVDSGEPFVYTTGKYPSQFEKTSVAIQLKAHPKQGGALVYDLRYDPIPYVKLTPEQIVELWRHRCDQRPCPHEKFPVKTLRFNRCPAVAPLSVLDSASQSRLQLSLPAIRRHQKILTAAPAFSARVLEAVELMDRQQQMRWLEDELDVDSRLYDGFVDSRDKKLMSTVRNSDSDGLAQLLDGFHDERLNALLPLYKARNFPKTLSAGERERWEQFKQRKLFGGKRDSRAARYFNRLAELAAEPNVTNEQRYLLEELQLYGQSVLPAEALA